ncbi:hypothetical protein MUK42_34449 [Musa troglodytarum]|uniref:Uncharacterized protein n=1 Tax=Musa troglodytarum TaxID=320322 RepID=A0A9E7KP13_9LILI|nr:hypothetical protein MUK42_34449 [Musa troglodytarum]
MSLWKLGSLPYHLCTYGGGLGTMAFIRGFKQARHLLAAFWKSTRIPSEIIHKIFGTVWFGPGHPVQTGPGSDRATAEPNGAEPGRSSRPCRAGPFKNCNGPGRTEPEAGPGRRFIPVLSGTGQNRVCPTRLGAAQLGAARLGSAPPGSARLRPARLGSARLGSVRLVSARPRLSAALPRTRLIPPPPGRGIVGMRNAPARARARVHLPSLFARLHFERSICSPTSPSKTTSSWLNLMDF